MATQMLRSFVLATAFLVVSAAPGLAQAQTGADPVATTGSTARQTARPILTAALEHARALPAEPAQEVDGQISGVVVDATGQPVADQRISLRRPSSYGRGRLVTTSDMNGQFVYAGLGPGRYEVELRDEGRVIATSGPIELSEDAMRVSGVTVARPAPPVPRQREPRWASADRLLGGQPVTESFDALQSILDPGHEVIVKDEEGRKTEGRVVSISANQLVIARSRSLLRWGTEERAFPEDVVRRIDIVDSAWQGLVIGLAVGAGVATLACRGEGVPAGYCLIIATPLFIIPGEFLGGMIDASINEPIYQRPSQTPRVTISPLLGRDQTGVVARVRF